MALSELLPIIFRRHSESAGKLFIKIGTAGNTNFSDNILNRKFFILQQSCSLLHPITLYQVTGSRIGYFFKLAIELTRTHRHAVGN